MLLPVRAPSCSGIPKRVMPSFHCGCHRYAVIIIWSGTAAYYSSYAGSADAVGATAAELRARHVAAAAAAKDVDDERKDTAQGQMPPVPPPQIAEPLPEVAPNGGRRQRQGTRQKPTPPPTSNPSRKGAGASRTYRKAQKTRQQLELLQRDNFLMEERLGPDDYDGELRAFENIRRQHAIIRDQQSTHDSEGELLRAARSVFALESGACLDCFKTHSPAPHRCCHRIEICSAVVSMIS